MENNFDFEDIRPYRDDEVKPAIAAMLQEKQFLQVLSYLYPDRNLEELAEELRQLDNIRDFQKNYIAAILKRMTLLSGSDCVLNGTEQLDRSQEHLFISNHRDIIMDAGMLNTLLFDKGFETAEVAFGDNLCANEWITSVFKLNKSFIVKRSGTKRELFDAFRKLSAYIRRNIMEKRNSVWIAQREGRTKDSNDRTQESLLKMFVLSAKEMRQGFIDLNITPISISYEFDSCDYLKAKEFQQKRDDANFKKTPMDDVLNMQTGITGYKGHIIYEITQPLNQKIEQYIQPDDDKNVVLEKMIWLIDHQIHLNYHLFPNNYVALDRLRGETKFAGTKYTQAEKERFDNYIQKQLDKIDLPNKDEAFLTQKLLEMYANPLINHLVALEEEKT